MLCLGYKSYGVLNLLPPEAFLLWEDFRTDFDVPGDEISQRQYAKGLEIGRKSKMCGPRLMGEKGQGSVYIRSNGTWAADIPPTMPNGTMAGFCSSYEGIGYHRATADLLHGFLDSGARVVVSRWYPGTCIEHTVIQELKEDDTP